ncbi:MAG: hypothetical protein MZW92_50230 [Comamonadaceae bacterium]|nr:hypothetical protein [Comamonadaceae bacterium]
MPAPPNAPGKSPHSFILEAIAEKAEQEERRGNFDDVAEQRYAEIRPQEDDSLERDACYLEDRLAGKAAKRPIARKLARLRMSRIELAPEVGRRPGPASSITHLPSTMSRTFPLRIRGDHSRPLAVLEQNPLIGRLRSLAR